MDSILNFMIALIVVQIALILYNIDIDFSIKFSNNLSWWTVFIPLYIFISIVAFGYWLFKDFRM